MKRLWLEAMGVSLFMWYWCPKVSVCLEVDHNIARQICGGNVAFAPREMPRAAVQHKAKSWRMFWNQSHIWCLANQWLARIMEGFL